MKSNRRRDTSPERRLRSELHHRGLRFRVDYPIVVTSLRVRADIVFTADMVAVFVDGCFWHRCPEHGTEPRRNAAYWKPKLDRNVARDRQVTAALTDAGWDVVRVWEHVPFHDGADLIELAVRSARAQARRGGQPPELRPSNRHPSPPV